VPEAKHIHILASNYVITPEFATAFHACRDRIPPLAGQGAVVFQKMHIFWNKSAGTIAKLDSLNTSQKQQADKISNKRRSWL